MRWSFYRRTDFCFRKSCCGMASVKFSLLLGHVLHSVCLYIVTSYLKKTIGLCVMYEL